MMFLRGKRGEKESTLCLLVWASLSALEMSGGSHTSAIKMEEVK